jgi:hypothetical protein
MELAEKLLAIEEIKQLKARYCRVIDEGRIEEWRGIFVVDAVALGPEVDAQPLIHGVEAMISFAQSALEGVVRNHHIHAPEIELLGDAKARGVWAMEDNLFWPQERPNMFGARRHFRGFGHYHEIYVKTTDGWRISEMQLIRTHVECDGETVTTAGA